MFGQNILYQYPQKILLDEKYLQTIDEKYPILAYTSSVGEIGIIKESFYRSGDNGAFQGLFSKNHKFTFRELQFILISIKKQFDLFGYATGMANVLELKFQLPTKNGDIDYDFMENFIAELEARHIAELEAYLSVTGLKDYNLSIIEQQTLTNYVSGEIELKEYNIFELFKIESYKKRFDANKVTVKDNGKFPYVVRMSTNNGQKGFIDENKEYLNDGNTISFGQDTATMFYQEKPFVGYAHIQGMYPIGKYKDKWNEKSLLFFLSVFRNRAINSNFDYVNKFTRESAKEMMIKLPADKDGNPDFLFMEEYMKKQEIVVSASLTKLQSAIDI